MSKIIDGIALGIGSQTGLGSINTDVRDATNLIVGPASPSGATGILLRNQEDLSKSMERIETEGGEFQGSFSQLPGSFIRVEPTVSFDIDWKGNGGVAGTPDAGDFDALEYLIQLFEGALLTQGTPTTSETPYVLGTPTEIFKTIKIWRGSDGAFTESWVIQDCTFTLAWNFVASEKSVLTVTVLGGTVTYDGSDTFPTNPVATAYGTQADASPILALAAAEIDGVTRGFTEASLALSYPETFIPDSNLSGGQAKIIGIPRTVEFSATWYGDDGATDFTTHLVDEIGAGPQKVEFQLGVAAGAGATVNAWRHTIPNFRGKTTDKADGDSARVLRTITGRGVLDSGDVADAEFFLEAI